MTPLSVSEARLYQHEELLAREGLYSRLYDIQFRKQEQHLEPELIEI